MRPTRWLNSARQLDHVLSLKDFMNKGAATKETINETTKTIQESIKGGSLQGLKFFIETYGCQMNVSDSEVVRSVLLSAGHTDCGNLEEADVILTNTCAIRENAEDKVWHRLDYFQSIRNQNRKLNIRKGGYPMVGVLGCMAERLKTKLLEEKSVDFVCGPDAYRDIPRLIASSSLGVMKEANTLLSHEETYADIQPVRDSYTAYQTSAFVSIMRGCNNMCTYCIVPFTRGRERSRPLNTILREVQTLQAKGIKEIVLLGQNVNGYYDQSEESQAMFPTHRKYTTAAGFQSLYKSKTRDGPGARFSDLLASVASVAPDVRVRFTSPHPKDFPDDVLDVIAAHSSNICPSLHLPAQSGSDAVLKRMRREYTRDAYLRLIDRCREKIPNVSFSSDFISGFCGETEEEHKETLSLIETVQYDMAFMFAYSLREKTAAAYHLRDDVPEEVKQRRLQEVIATYQVNAQKVIHRSEPAGSQRLVLVDGFQPLKAKHVAVWTRLLRTLLARPASGESSLALQQMLDQVQRDGSLAGIQWYSSRTDTNHKCLVPVLPSSSLALVPGDYAVMEIFEVVGKTVIGLPMGRSTPSTYVPRA